MKLSLASVSIQRDSSLEIARAIQSSSTGVLMVNDLPQAPFANIASMFDSLAHEQAAPGARLTDRLNAAYPNNLVYKDAFANDKGGPKIDMKRVLDLSPDRLHIMKQNDPALAEIVDTTTKDPLGMTLAYWDLLRTTTTPKLIEAVSKAIGCDVSVLQDDSAFNYRMVDYYERSNEQSMIPPRCGQHRDFGSFTLIFPTHGGLQVFVDGEWMDVESPMPGSAILLFGWCTQIRSNGRIPAALHRVTDPTKPEDSCVPRRIAAVLFCAPKNGDTPLEPVLVTDNEEPKYISGVRAGRLRGSMARKWQMREGTLPPPDAILEEAEILTTQMLTQDDVVRQTIAA